MSELSTATSEGVRFAREIAGAGSRFAAALLDLLWIGSAYLALAIGVWIFSNAEPTGVSDFVLGLLLGGAVLVVVGYQVGFHLAWHGETPGKRALGLRVVSSSGHPASALAFVLRGLVAPLDVLTLPLPIGLIVIAATERHQRFGDLVADTVVVRARAESSASVGSSASIEPWPDVRWSTLPGRTLSLTAGHAARFAPRDREFLRAVITRADLAPESRRRLFVDVARAYAVRVGLAGFDDARVVLKELYLFARESQSARGSIHGIEPELGGVNARGGIGSAVRGTAPGDRSRPR